MQYLPLTLVLLSFACFLIGVVFRSIGRAEPLNRFYHSLETYEAQLKDEAA